MTLFTLVVLLIFASSVMYFAENEAQPEKFTSIPASMWWGVATLTTVGYGDVFPVTSLGQLFGAVIAILGVGFFALPTGILASGFAEEIQKRRRRESVICPHCGRDITAADASGAASGRGRGDYEWAKVPAEARARVHEDSSLCDSAPLRSAVRNLSYST